MFVLFVVCFFLLMCVATVKPVNFGHLEWEKPLSMGSFLLVATPNRVLTAHTEWLPGVQLRHSVPPVQYTWRIVRVGGCLAVMAQWQSTGGSSQRFPGFDSLRLLAFSLSSIFPHIISKFLYF